MNTINLRTKTKNDIIPSRNEGQSWTEWFKQLNGESKVVYGSIGYTGTKVHMFIADYININGENVIVGLTSSCGSQSYVSGLGVNFNYNEEHITCKKCMSKK
jgi:hypothetical protein